jgi:hypothetical protein
MLSRHLNISIKKSFFSKNEGFFERRRFFMKITHRELLNMLSKIFLFRKYIFLPGFKTSLVFEPRLYFMDQKGIEA